MGDEDALKLIDQERNYLGLGFSNLIHLYSSELIVFDGGISASYDLMSHRLIKVMNENTMLGFGIVDLKPSELFQDSGLCEAAQLFLIQESLTFF